jgi:hypothetical protein
MLVRFCAPIVAALLVLVPSTARADEAPAPEPVLQYLPAHLPEERVIDYSAVIAYMRTLPPDVLIDIAFDGTGAAPKMKAIARRESGLGRHGAPTPFDPACAAANPRSSARGLFQTLYGWNGTAVAWDLTWGNIAGPDCLDDVILARKIWDRSGFRPWSM